MSRTTTRWLASGGVIGPSTFLAAWVGGGMLSGVAGSSIEDPISRLAAIDAPTRWLMTAGFAGFALGVSGFALALRFDLGGPSWTAAAVAAGSTLLVACAPLDHSLLVDRLHGLFAGVGYLAVSATPLLAARRLLQRGQSGLAAAGVVSGVVSAAALAASLLGAPAGLFQRIGLTVADAWIVAMALSVMLTPRERFRPLEHGERLRRG